MKAMIWLLLPAILAAGGLFYLHWRMTHTPDRGNLQQAIAREAKKYLGKQLRDGVVIGVFKAGQTFVQGYGVLDKNDTRVPDGDTLFQIASAGKLFTAATLQILCDEGDLEIDATLQQVIGAKHPLDPAVQNITLRQLATHTSGLPGLPRLWVKRLIKKVGRANIMQNPYSHFDVEEVWDYLQNPEDKRKPGRFVYSNLGMGLLGHVLEEVSGQSLEALVADNLLRPLGMTHSGMATDGLVPGHDARGDSAQPWTFGLLYGAGAFHSCVSDMLSFIKANLHSNAPLANSLHKMHERHAGGKTGIGWMQASPLDRFIGNNTLIWHDGRVGGYGSYIAIDPERQTGLVVLTNRSAELAMLGTMLARQIRTQSW
ncbi:MAG: serine hydrolase domain-containing protein [Thiolinea sp.]